MVTGLGESVAKLWTKKLSFALCSVQCRPDTKMQIKINCVFPGRRVNE